VRVESLRPRLAGGGRVLLVLKVEQTPRVEHRSVGGTSCDPLAKANFETRISRYRVQGLEPNQGAFKRSEQTLKPGYRVTGF
jgi:hypothetical protein